MPSNMAMQRPGPRVIRLDLQDDVRICRELVYISPLRIHGIRNGSIPCSRSLMQHEKVMTMHVHGMRWEAFWVVDDKCY
jgi:hypothetical protein